MRSHYATRNKPNKIYSGMMTKLKFQTIAQIPSKYPTVRRPIFQDPLPVISQIHGVLVRRAAYNTSVMKIKSHRDMFGDSVFILPASVAARLLAGLASIGNKINAVAEANTSGAVTVRTKLGDTHPLTRAKLNGKSGSLFGSSYVPNSPGVSAVARYPPDSINKENGS
jgi:hypothetical protein